MINPIAYQNIKNVTIQDLWELYQLKEISVVDALPIIREFAEHHGLSDSDAKRAFSIAMTLFDTP